MTEPDDRLGATLSDRERHDLLVRHTVTRLLSPVAAELRDPSVEEILINGPDDVYVVRAGVNRKIEAARFDSEEELASAARAIAQLSGKRLTPLEPAVEARLPLPDAVDGEGRDLPQGDARVQIVQAPASRNGLALAIRKYLKSVTSIDSLVANGDLTEEAADFLRDCVDIRKNVIISGGTGTGKTTLLGALSESFAATDRVVVIEDVKELQIRRPHVLYLEAQKPDRFGRGGITIRELFRATLRLRPDRILVGECRGGEAIDMIQAMTSGHTGSLSTVHATTPYDAMARLETMALMADVAVPMVALRRQLASAVDLVVQIARTRSGGRHVASIAEIVGLDAAGNYEIRTLFERRRGDGARALRWTGERPTFLAELIHETSPAPSPSREGWWRRPETTETTSGRSAVAKNEGMI